MRSVAPAKIWEKATLAFADMFPHFLLGSYRIAIHPLGQIPLGE